MKPKVKLKAAVVIILQKDNKVLLFKRQNSGWADGMYTAPSGHIDEGELPTEAAVRESKEETGVDVLVEDLRLVHVDYVRDAVIDFYFLVEKWSGEAVLVEVEKSSDMEWFSLDNLPENIAGHGSEVLESIRAGKFYSEVG